MRAQIRFRLAVHSDVVHTVRDIVSLCTMHMRDIRLTVDEECELRVGQCYFTNVLINVLVLTKQLSSPTAVGYQKQNYGDNMEENAMTLPDATR